MREDLPPRAKFVKRLDQMEKAVDAAREEFRDRKRELLRQFLMDEQIDPYMDELLLSLTADAEELKSLVLGEEIFGGGNILSDREKVANCLAGKLGTLCEARLPSGSPKHVLVKRFLRQAKEFIYNLADQIVREAAGQ